MIYEWISRAELSNVWKWIDKAKVQQQIKEAELALAKAHYLEQLQYTQDHFDDEVEKAQIIMRLKEEYDDRVRQINEEEGMTECI